MGITREHPQKHSLLPLGLLTPEQIAFNKAGEIRTIAGILFAVAMIVVLLRFYVRIRIVKAFRKDDWAMLVAMLCFIGTFVCILVRTEYGLGRYLAVAMNNRHGWRHQNQATYVEVIVILVGVSAVKVTIGLCLLQFSISRVYKHCLYVAITFIVVFGLGCCGGLIAQCVPIQAAWDPILQPPPIGMGHAKCVTETTMVNLGILNSASQVFTDALFAAMAVPLIWKLTLSRRTKFSLLFVMSLGWFACAAAIVKTYKLSHYRFFDDRQNLYDTFFLWYFAEFAVGIIAASLPPMRSLLSRIFASITSSLRSRTKLLDWLETTSNSVFDTKAERRIHLPIGRIDSIQDSEPKSGLRSDSEERILHTGLAAQKGSLERPTNQCQTVEVLPSPGPDRC